MTNVYVCHLLVWVFVYDCLGRTHAASFEGLDLILYLQFDCFVKEMLWKSAYGNF